MDICSILPNLLVSGLPWRQRTEIKSNRNNVDELGNYLLGSRYMIWNLAGDTAQGTYPLAPLHNQVLVFGLSKAHHLHIKSLIDVSRSIALWLGLDCRNIAVVHCTNGLARTGLAIACTLRYMNVFNDTRDAYDFFVRQRGPGYRLPIALERYLDYFNTIYSLGGALPNGYPLKMHRVVLNGIPRFDSQGSCHPGIEIYESGQLVFSSMAHLVEVQMTKESCFFDLDELVLERDVQLRIFHVPMLLTPTSQPNQYASQPSQVVTMFSFSFHTGFMPPNGTVRVSLKDLETGKRLESDDRFPPRFSLDLQVSEGTPKVRCLDSKTTKLKLSYEKSLNEPASQSLARLVRFHQAKAPEHLITQLESNGYLRTACRFGLQRANGNLKMAIQELSELSISHPELVFKAQRNSIDKGSFRSNSHLSNTSSDALYIPEDHLDSVDELRPRISNSGSLLRAKAAATRLENLLEKSKPSRSFSKLSIRSEPVSGSDTSLARSNTVLRNTSIKRLEQLLSRGNSVMSSHVAASPIEGLPLVEEPDEITVTPSLIDTVSPTSLSDRSIRNSDNHSWAVASSDGNSDVDSIEIPPASRTSVFTIDSRSSQSDLFIPPELEAEFETVVIPVFPDPSVSVPRRRKRAVPIPQPIKVAKPIPDTESPLTPILAKEKDTANLSVIELDVDESLESREPTVIGSEFPTSLDSIEEEKTLSPDTLVASSPFFIPEAPPPPMILNMPQKIIPMAPPPPPVFIPIQVPPPVPSIISSIDSQPSIKSRAKLHWNEIRNIENSVWKELRAPQDLESQKSVTLDLKRFEELFCIAPGGDKRPFKQPSEPQKTKFTTFLELRRANNISIGLSRFTRRGFTTSSLIQAVKEMNDEVLGLDDLIALQSLLPNSDELTLVQYHASHPPREGQPAFAIAEAFVVETVGHKDLPNQVVSFLFKLSLPAEVEDLSSKFMKLTSVSKELKSSQELKVILGTVLELGNLTNYQYATSKPFQNQESKALGFRIEGLARLKDVKSADGKWTLMTFLVDMLEKEQPGVLSLVDCFTDLASVRHYDIQELVQAIEKLESSLDRIGNVRYTDSEFESRLISFLETAVGCIDNLKREFESFVRFWKEALVYFGEDLDDYVIPCLNASSSETVRKKASHLYVSLDAFFQGFKEAVFSSRQRKLDEERRVVREVRAREDGARRAVAKIEKSLKDQVLNYDLEIQEESLKDQILNHDFQTQRSRKDHGYSRDETQGTNQEYHAQEEMVKEASQMIRRLSVLPMTL